jgi:hydrogenase expression/formation protein HypE
MSGTTPMEDKYISLAHGNGGRYMRELIAKVFARHLANPVLDTGADAVALPLTDGDVMVTTDGFTVQPLEFPGGDIGSLAVHGTVNDLAVAGATPKYLTLNAFIEEGLEVALLDRIVASVARSARACEVSVVAGDTKVVRRGEGSGLYLATTGVGVRDRTVRIGMDRIEAGDRILVSGPVGDHGIAVMLAREQFGLKGDLQSDAASVYPLTKVLLGVPGLRFMRDPTRGGIASVAHEIRQATGMGLRLQQVAVPVQEAVRTVCEMLGYDPFYLACEGRVVAVVSPDDADAALDRWQRLPDGKQAALVGSIDAGTQHVVLETELGGERILEELEDDPLPRIC